MTLHYVLDTDTCVGWLRGRESVRRRVVEVGLAAIAISIVTLAELRYGAACSASPAENHQAIDNFLTGITVVGLDSLATRTFGNVKADLRVRGMLIEDADLFIAATALANQLVLVTNNTSHFARIPDLVLENWLIM